MLHLSLFKRKEWFCVMCAVLLPPQNAHAATVPTTVETLVLKWTGKKEDTTESATIAMPWKAV
jgi:hypothetical protein